MTHPLRGAEEPDDDELLTAWERDFLDSIESQDYDLTDAQEAKRDEIYALLEERREAWRQAEELAPGSGAIDRVVARLRRERRRS